MKNKYGKDIAVKMLDKIYDDLCIDVDFIEKDDAYNKMLTALMQGRLECKNEVFTLKLLKPVKTGEKEISSLEISEPKGVQLRSASEVKDIDDNIGKAMAVLGDVTGCGLPVINELKSRDLMAAVGVISLFL